MSSLSVRRTMFVKRRLTQKKIIFVLLSFVCLMILLKKDNDNIVKNTIIFISAQVRSGSRFTGRLLSVGDSVFYIEEPLSEAVNGHEEIHNVTLFLEDIMNCRFHKYPRYYNFRHKHQQGIDLMNTLTEFRELMFDPKNIETICNASRYRIIRLTLGRLNDLMPLISEPNVIVKVISLVRDPRGIYNSKKNFTHKDIQRPNVCEKMIDDLKTERKFGLASSERYKKLRYEDLALQPQKTARSLYSWMGIPYSIKVETVVSVYTQTDTEEFHKFGLRKRSQLRVIDWKNEAIFHNITNIQNRCRDIFNEYHYRLTNTEDETRRLNYTIYL